MTFPPTVTEPLLACCSGFAESGLLDVSSLACAIVRIGNAAKEIISTTTHKASLPIVVSPIYKLSENLILLAQLGLSLRVKTKIAQTTSVRQRRFVRIAHLARKCRRTAQWRQQFCPLSRWEYLPPA